MKALLCQSALANVALVIALIWMHESDKADRRDWLEITWNAEDTHMKVHALALNAIEKPDPLATEKATTVLRSMVRAWENEDERERIRQAFRQASR